MSERVDPIPSEVRVFQGRRAGLVTRAVASVIDAAVVATLLAGAYLAVCALLFLARPARFDFPTPAFWFDVAVGYVVTTVYLGMTWHSGGRTYGCHVMGLRVTDHEGGLLSLVTAYLRALFCVVFPLGLAWVAVSRWNSSLQDLVLHTSVLYDWDVRPMSRAVHSVEAARQAGSADD
jgi:uncharacterized RDD family membrane protein YckC